MGGRADRVSLTVIGSGDAFNSGARFNAAYCVEAPGCTFLLDCGPTTLLALKHHGFDPSTIDFVLLSHLHGDHFAGLPSLLLEYMYESPRQRPLLVAGPRGVEERVRMLFATCYKEVASRPLPFSLEFKELVPDSVAKIGMAKVLPVDVPHQSIDLSLGFSISVGARKLVYSGDSAWTERFVELSQGADLFLCECTYYQKEIDFHIDYVRLEKHLSRLSPKRLVLTHLGSDILPWLSRVSVECAWDGLVIEL